MAYQQNNCAEEDDPADDKTSLVCDCFRRIRQSRRIDLACILCKLLAENKVEINYYQNQCDKCDQTGVCYKSAKENPRDVPMIMFGGSPHIVADPPRFAQKISARIIGTGLNFNSCESSTVTAARNRITVILSMNIASTKDSSINVIKIGIT